MAFTQVLHGRYGGGVELAAAADGDDQAVQTLREPHGEDRIRLILSQSDGPASTPQGHGRLIGTTRLSATGDIEDVAIATEIFDVADPNEAADAAYLGGGLLLSPMPDHLPAGALGVLRSREAAISGAQQTLQSQRGWLARQQRQNPNRPLGLTNKGHRRSPASFILRPVSADLLTRIGGAVASLTPGAQSGAPSGKIVRLVVQTGIGDMA